MDERVLTDDEYNAYLQIKDDIHETLTLGPTRKWRKFIVDEDSHKSNVIFNYIWLAIGSNSFSKLIYYLDYGILNKEVCFKSKYSIMKSISKIYCEEIQRDVLRYNRMDLFDQIENPIEDIISYRKLISL